MTLGKKFVYPPPPQMGIIHKKKYITYNILTDFASKYTMYIYFENFGKYIIYNVLLSQKAY